MSYLKADVGFPSHLSYKTPGRSTQYAHPALVPGPTAIKLAIVSSAIQSTGSVETGKNVFESVKDSKISYQVPQNLGVWIGVIKRLKKKRNEDNAFQSTFSQRGYVFYKDSITLFFDSSKENLKVLKKFLPKIRYIGTADSLTTVRNEEMISKIPEGTTTGRDSLKEDAHGIVQILRDIKSNTSFDRINPYSEKGGRGDPYKDLFFTFPYEIKDRERQWVLYEKI